MNTHNLKPFKKGQSGNPNGRPKGTQNRTTIARKWLALSDLHTNPITNVEENLSYEDLITLRQIKEAREGSTHAYKAVLDSAYGTPKGELDITTDGDKILGTGKIEL